MKINKHLDYLKKIKQKRTIIFNLNSEYTQVTTFAFLTGYFYGVSAGSIAYYLVASKFLSLPSSPIAVCILLSSITFLIISVLIHFELLNQHSKYENSIKDNILKSK